MIDLPDVTLFGIDCVTPLKTLEAMEFSTRWVKFGEVVLLTDLKAAPWEVRMLPKEIGYKVPVRYVDHQESNRKVVRPLAPWNKPLPIDYEMASMVEPVKHMRTRYILFIEWDAAVLNPRAFERVFWAYDYIGAPWSPHHEPGFPECDGRTNAVGNAGFSLRSRAYCEAMVGMCAEFKDDPNLISCDMYPCRTGRKWLEAKYGIKFAPADVAARFSCENRIYAGEFGFHGRWTAEMNNWSGPFFSQIRPMDCNYIQCY